jgi:exopolysaccharide biosynthesis WecB/TagA/CpsF family protein
MNEVKILNVSLDNFSKVEFLEKLKHGGFVITPNVDHLMKLQKDPEFYQVYQEADYRVCDSKILMYAADFLGNPIKEKLSGSDLFPAFYQYYKDDEDVKIFLLGAAEGVAHQAQEKINTQVGREMVIGAYSPSFGFEKDEAECDYIIDLINQSDATVLAVGVGAPKQEKWIAKYKDRLKKIKVFLAIGATIDFEAGYVARSPKWMSELGIEWLHRLMSEPQRLAKRYLIEDMPFFWLLLQQKLNRYNYKMPIGTLLRQAGLISNAQLDMILKQQRNHPNLRFGDILAMHGWLKHETVDFFAEQFPQLPKMKQKQPLGQYLKAAALLDELQIRSILAEQDEVNLRFGELAVRKGWVKRETVELFVSSLSTQETDRPSLDQVNQSSSWTSPVTKSVG